jgi:hypothetical protein
MMTQESRPGRETKAADNQNSGDTSILQAERSATLETALELHAHGLSVVAVRPDGSKAPQGSWRCYQERQPTIAEIRSWFGHGTTAGLGLITGYGGVEMTETEAGCRPQNASAAGARLRLRTA